MVFPVAHDCPTRSKSLTPKGDGNPFHRGISSDPNRVQNPLPRKGTETRSVFCRLRRRPVQNPLPRKGTETSLGSRLRELAPVDRSKSLTPKGDGNDFSGFVAGFVTGSKSLTPKGDGNLIFRISVNTAVTSFKIPYPERGRKQFDLEEGVGALQSSKSLTPKGDGNQLRVLEILLQLEPFKIPYPERGRKRLLLRRLAVVASRRSKSLTPKGDGNRIVQLPVVRPTRFKIPYPERGRKLLLAYLDGRRISRFKIPYPERGRKPTIGAQGGNNPGSSKSLTPKGDGNSSVAYPPARVWHAVQNPLPRKGTETR